MKKINKAAIILLEFVLMIFAINVDGQKTSQMKIDLSGKWLFSRDEAKVGLAEKWYHEKLKTVGGGPSEIALPGSTDEAKADIQKPQKPNLDGLYRPNHWVTHVWLDGKEFGTKDNLITPQIYDMGINVKPGKYRLTICVDNTLKFDLGRFVSINYEGTQTNWNDIVGKIELTAADLVSLSKVEVYPDIDYKLIKAKAHISNAAGLPVKGDVQIAVADATGTIVGKFLSTSLSTQHRESLVTIEIPMGKNPKLWDEFSPYLYVLKISLSTKSPECHSGKIVSIGMRKLAVKGTQFTMNGRPLMLRSTLECAIFPKPVYPRTDAVSCRRIFKKEKSYGLNFIRFHSGTPPDAAFTAADQEGIMIQTEAPQANVPAGKVA